MRYLGGKKRQAKRIVQEIISRVEPERIWLEPFVGGANVACVAASSGHFSRLVLADASALVVEMWRAGILGWRPPDSISKDLYEHLRQTREVSALAGFVHLAASYNGKPWGGYGGGEHSGRNYYEESIRAFDRDCACLSRHPNVSFLCCDFSRIRIEPDAVVYCDPPYANTTGYLHTVSGFWRWASSIDFPRVSVFVSEFSQNIPEGWSIVSRWSRSSTIDANVTRTNEEVLVCRNVD